MHTVLLTICCAGFTVGVYIVGYYSGKIDGLQEAKRIYSKETRP